VIFQNPDDRDLFIRRRLVRAPEQTGLTAGSGVELDLYPVTRPAPGPIFLMMARLLKAKGVPEYAEAAISLRARYPDARFRLAGWRDDGPDMITRAQLDSYVAAGVEYLGHLKEVQAALADCSVYVLPSCYREGVPRSILEALSSGRAVITTDMPGCRETVVPGENGFIVPPRDAAALASAMERFIVEPDLAAAMGARSRILAAEVFDSRTVAAETMRLAGLE
jgi:glycosyltransferase involved in cell wall biosynthesis